MDKNPLVVVLGVLASIAAIGSFVLALGVGRSDGESGQVIEARRPDPTSTQVTTSTAGVAREESTTSTSPPVTTVVPTSTQTTSPPTTTPRPRIDPGVIDDGRHYGHFRGEESGTFAFDRADIEDGGVWANTNALIRELPIAAPLGLTPGVAIEVVVQDQTVASVQRLNSFAVDETHPLIPPGTIEDRVHYGVITEVRPDGFGFDRWTVSPEGEWTNNLTTARQLPYTGALGFGVGTRVGIDVLHQRVVQVWSEE